MTKIDPASVPGVQGCGYPTPFDELCNQRIRQQLGRSKGLTHFGVNLTRIAPGGWSSQRHWHSHEDEFIYMVEGELTLVTDGGEEILRVGDCAAFKAGVADGHHLVNRSAHDAKYLEIGSSNENDRCVYPDIDMIAEPGQEAYSHRNGSLYPIKRT